MMMGIGVSIASVAELLSESLPSTASVNYSGFSWAWIIASVLLGMVSASLITMIIIYWMRRRKDEVMKSVSAFPFPRKAEPMPVLKKNQVIHDLPITSVSPNVLAALQGGLEIQELSFSLLDEVLRVTQITYLHEIDNELLREKLVRCVMGLGITKLLPHQANILWACVLSWDPSGNNLEKQTQDMLSWICDDSGEYDSAKAIIEHSRHNIPVPEQLPLNNNIMLLFDRNPNTLLDEGASASVFRAKVKGGRDVAVKISRLTDYGILRNTLSEYLMLRRAQGIDAIIRLYGVGCYHVGEEVFFYIVEEIAQTTLDGEFERRKAAKEPYSEREVRDHIVKPFLMALGKLHERGILHRDLKPKNIYRVDEAYKIGDFEIAAYSPNASRTLDTGMFAGSPAYTTAAALMGRYGPETDINALACISFMMLRGDLPAIDNTLGTSTLIRGIQGGSPLTHDGELQQEKAKKAVQEWLTQKKGFVTDIRQSLRSTPFERFFIAPILSQGLYAKSAPGAILTTDEALKVLGRIELSEKAQEVRRKALAFAEARDFESARKILMDFDALFHRESHDKIEVSMHVMLGETMKEIDNREFKSPDARQEIQV